MKFLDLKYIAYYKYLNIATILIMLIFFLILGIPVNPVTVIGTVLFIFHISGKYGFERSVALKELRRRIYQLPIARDNELIWKHKGSIGIFFVDRQCNVFWYCGTQSNFEAIALPLSEVSIYDSYDRITIIHPSWNTEVVAFKN